MLLSNFISIFFTSFTLRVNFRSYILMEPSSKDSRSHQKQCSWGGWRRCMHDILNFVTFCKAHKYETFRYLQIHNIMSHLIVVPARNNSYTEIAAKMFCSGSFVMPRMKIAGIYIHPGSLPSMLPSPWFTLLEYGLRKGHTQIIINSHKQVC